MTNIQLPQITKDRLLELEAGEIGTFIVPIEISDKAFSSKELYKELIIEESPLQSGDKFYIGSADTAPDKMQPHQSRFQGKCLSVEVIKINSIVSPNDMLNKLKYNAIVFQHNKLFNTNITPIMDDYVFLIEIKRR